MTEAPMTPVANGAVLPLGSLLAVAFTVSVFFMSNDDTWKIMSAPPSAILGAMILPYMVLRVLARHHVPLSKHALQLPLYGMLFWAAASLILSSVLTENRISKEAWSYRWAIGLNSPELRGWSFLARLIFSVLTIDFLFTWCVNSNRFFGLLRLAVVCYFLCSIFGVVQLALHLLFDVRIGFQVTEEGVTGLRIGGYIGEPQTYGIILIAFYMLVVAGLLYRSYELGLPRWFLLLTFASATITLISTFSVTMFFGLTVATLVVMRRVVRLRTFAGFFFMGALVIVALYPYFRDNVYQKLISQALSLNARTFTWISGLVMFRDNLFFGVGIGQIPFMSAQYIPDLPGIETIVPDYSVLRQTPLNTYIEWAAETGLPGLLLLASALFLLFSRVLKKGRTAEQRFLQLALGSPVVALSVAAFSTPNFLNVGCYLFVIALYLAGWRLFFETRTAGP